MVAFRTLLKLSSILSVWHMDQIACQGPQEEFRSFGILGTPFPSTNLHYDAVCKQFCKAINLLTKVRCGYAEPTPDMKGVIVYCKSKYDVERIHKLGKITVANTKILLEPLSRTFLAERATRLVLIRNLPTDVCAFYTNYLLTTSLRNHSEESLSVYYNAKSVGPEGVTVAVHFPEHEFHKYKQIQQKLNHKELFGCEIEARILKHDESNVNEGFIENEDSNILSKKSDARRVNAIRKKKVPEEVSYAQSPVVELHMSRPCTMEQVEEILDRYPYCTYKKIVSANTSSLSGHSIPKLSKKQLSKPSAGKSKVSRYHVLLHDWFTALLLRSALLAPAISPSSLCVKDVSLLGNMTWDSIPLSSHGLPGSHPNDKRYILFLSGLEGDMEVIINHSLQSLFSGASSEMEIRSIGLTTQTALLCFESEHSAALVHTWRRPSLLGMPLEYTMIPREYVPMKIPLSTPEKPFRLRFFVQINPSSAATYTESVGHDLLSSLANFLRRRVTGPLAGGFLTCSYVQERDSHIFYEDQNGDECQISENQDKTNLRTFEYSILFVHSACPDVAAVLSLSSDRKSKLWRNRDSDNGELISGTTSRKRKVGSDSCDETHPFSATKQSSDYPNDSASLQRKPPRRFSCYYVLNMYVRGVSDTI